MQDESTILSVGIDIGTSTTQVIFSRLTFKNTAGYFAVPHVAISGKEIVYKGKIYQTPLLNRTMIDGREVRRLVEQEFSSAGFAPADTQTGAVIITGESARKENSEIVLKELSQFAGEFVVSTAGPDLEAIIAGKGSGARQYSIDHNCTVANVDIGGGTANAVIFDCGETVAKGCLDIGGRLVIVDEMHRVTYISDSVKRIIEENHVTLDIGDFADDDVMEQLSKYMAAVLFQWINQECNDLIHNITTPGSSPFEYRKPIRAVCFSGGVAESIYHPNPDQKYLYHDIGYFLGKAIHDELPGKSFKLADVQETIRATVVGAGSYTTTVSGSTITYNRDVFPMKNVPVVRLDIEEEDACFRGEEKPLLDKMKWMQAQSDSKQLVLGMKGKKNPSYIEVKRLAGVLADVLDKVLEPGQPMLVVLESDIAKVLGQLMLRMPASSGRDVICIDAVIVEQNDFVDLGKPLMNGLVVPVVVKTLIFG